MAIQEDKFGKFKQAGLSIISAAALFALVWFLFYGKVKAKNLVSPLIDKLPKDEAGLVKKTEEILGAAVSRISDEGTKEIVEKSSDFFEESAYAEPARDLRDNVKEKVNEVIDSAKELPAREVKHIQLEICRQWLGDDAVSATGAANGRNN